MTFSNGSSTLPARPPTPHCVAALTCLVACALPALADDLPGIVVHPARPNNAEPFLIVLADYGSCPALLSVDVHSGWPGRIDIDYTRGGCLSPPRAFVFEIPVGPAHIGTWTISVSRDGELQAEVPLLVNEVALALAFSPQAGG